MQISINPHVVLPLNNYLVHQDRIVTVIEGVQRTVSVAAVDVGTFVDETILLLQDFILITFELGETPFVGDDNVLTTGELVLRTTERFDDGMLLLVLTANRQDDITDGNTGYQASGLAKGATHARLQTDSSAS